ncbi:BLUF domain-containing protein [Curvibacter sp. HBC61]|uniref:BLUF domain-containing protein n=1 Tax=Curvibacter cyanobacteriorum TaxID=3026422 RepID=A0ABT5MXD4_9BURK|nr:BLUF domain-containing protein [Curvibacter sp. HBC61]MDD0838710.1 BLUF domain-containing protein [Curvibacter sp. HBC61]
MLIRLTYASRVKDSLGPADVKDIVRASKRNNARLGITGTLLLVDGIFLQCLEGGLLPVNTLYHRILLDPRHQQPALLNFAEIDRRLFGGWHMGLVPATADNLALLMAYSPSAQFDPYAMRPRALDALLEELVSRARVLSE